MFGFGSFSHLLLLFVLGLILIGPKQLPEVARTLGRLLTELRRASNMFTEQFNSQLRDLEQPFQQQNQHQNQQHNQQQQDQQNTAQSHQAPVDSPHQDVHAHDPIATHEHGDYHTVIPAPDFVDTTTNPPNPKSDEKKS